MKKKPIFPLLLGLLLLLLFVLMSVRPALFTAYGQKEQFTQWLKPSAEHLLGTNAMGYDVWTELVCAAKETLYVGLASSILCLALGTLIGVLSVRKGIVGAVFNGLINVFVLLPRLICLIVLSGFLGSSRQNLIALISAFNWVGIARNVRAKVVHIHEQPFMEALTIQGFSRFHIVLHHVLPNLSDVLLSRFLLGVNSCIMLESTLSFLGFGDLYHPSWGTMINFAYKRGAFLRGAYGYLLSPGACIVLLSLSFYFVSLWFEDRQNSVED